MFSSIFLYSYFYQISVVFKGELAGWLCLRCAGCGCWSAEPSPTFHQKPQLHSHLRATCHLVEVGHYHQEQELTLRGGAEPVLIGTAWRENGMEGVGQSGGGRCGKPLSGGSSASGPRSGRVEPGVGRVVQPRSAWGRNRANPKKHPHSTSMSNICPART